MKWRTYTEALREALRDALGESSEVVLMGEDIGTYGGAFGVTRGLSDEYGADRVIDTPISEASFTGMGVGAALTGMRPVIEIMFMDFITLTFDQLCNQAAKLHWVFGDQAECPLVIRTPAGGGKCYGPTHSQNLTASFLNIPGIKICVPSTPQDAYFLLSHAVRDPNPVLFVEHKTLYPLKGEVAEEGDAEEDQPAPYGQAEFVNDGEDVTIVAWSGMTPEAYKAVQELEKEDVYASLIDMRTLVPLDIDTVTRSVEETGRLLIVEEAPRSGGVAAEISARVCEAAYDSLEAPIQRLTMPDTPVPASPPLEDHVLPSAENIYEQAKQLVDEA